jgi:hypothetical protein
LITGGHRGRHSDIVIYDSAEIYDPATGKFSLTGHMNLRRHKHDAVLLMDGRVLISGGSDEHDDQDAYASAEIYDPSKEIFSMVSNMPTVRYKHIGTSLLLQNGDVRSQAEREMRSSMTRKTIYSVLFPEIWELQYYPACSQRPP